MAGLLVGLLQSVRAFVTAKLLQLKQTACFFIIFMFLVTPCSPDVGHAQSELCVVESMGQWVFLHPVN